MYQARGQRNIAIAGLYPPRDAQPNDPYGNKTSTLAGAILGNYDFNWLDYCTTCAVSPSTSNGGIDQASIAAYALRHDDATRDLHARFRQALQGSLSAGTAAADTRLPVIYVGGTTMQAVFDRMRQLHLITFTQPVGDIAWVADFGGGLAAIVVLGPHLSSGMMAGGAAEARHAVDAALRIAGAPVKAPTKAHAHARAHVHTAACKH